MATKAKETKIFMRDNLVETRILNIENIGNQGAARVKVTGPTFSRDTRIVTDANNKKGVREMKAKKSPLKRCSVKDLRLLIEKEKPEDKIILIETSTSSESKARIGKNRAYTATIVFMVSSGPE